MFNSRRNLSCIFFWNGECKRVAALCSCDCNDRRHSAPALMSFHRTQFDGSGNAETRSLATGEVIDQQPLVQSFFELPRAQVWSTALLLRAPPRRWPLQKISFRRRAAQPPPDPEEKSLALGPAFVPRVYTGDKTRAAVPGCQPASRLRGCQPWSSRQRRGAAARCEKEWVPA